jgi:hypothetical protein
MALRAERAIALSMRPLTGAIMSQIPVGGLAKGGFVMEFREKRQVRNEKFILP